MLWATAWIALLRRALPARARIALLALIRSLVRTLAVRSLVRTIRSVLWLRGSVALPVRALLVRALAVRSVLWLRRSVALPVRSLLVRALAVRSVLLC